MKRAVLTLAAAAALTFATALPVASALKEVTVSCDDGTSFTSVVDAQTLAGLTDANGNVTIHPAQ